MDAGGSTPLLDFFKRGEVDRDIRLMVAQQVLGLRPHEQIGLLELLVDDRDPDVAAAARASLQAMTPAPQGNAPAAPDTTAGADATGAPQTSALERIAAMSPAQRLSL